MKKKFGLTLVGALLLFGGMSVGALASAQLQEIKAYLNGEIKVRMNGQVVQLNDASGKAVLPITYNGTTYLPVRAVSTVLDIPVQYDGGAKEVLLGERLEGVPINQEQFSNTLYTKDSALTTYGGKDYKEVLYSPPNDTFNYTAFTPNGKYKTLVLQFAAIEKEVESIEIIDNDTNALLKKVEAVTIEEGLKTIEVDISGVKNIAINVKKPKEGGFLIPLTTSYYK